MDILWNADFLYFMIPASCFFHLFFQLFPARFLLRADVEDGVRQFADAWPFDRAAAVAVLPCWCGCIGTMIAVDDGKLRTAPRLCTVFSGQGHVEDNFFVKAVDKHKNDDNFN